MIGLIKAIDTFDYQNSHRFVTYTSIVIRREITLNIYTNNFTIKFKACQVGSRLFYKILLLPYLLDGHFDY